MSAQSGMRTRKKKISHSALRARRTRSSVSLCLCGSLISVFSLALSVEASAQARTWPTEAPPRPLPARDIKFPPYEIQTLPNGLQVVAVLHHEQPAVTMRLLVRAGAASDPKDKLGVARLMASLLDQGTTTKTAQETNDAIDFIGGVMGAYAVTYPRARVRTLVFLGFFVP